MYSNSFRHNQSYPGIIQAYSDIFRIPCNPGVFRTRDIFRTLVYSKAWHSQYQRPIQKPVKDPWGCILQKQLMTTIIYTNYNYCCNISFSHPVLYERSIMIFLNTGLTFTRYVFILSKKVWGWRGPGAGGHGFWNTLKFS